MRRRWVYVDGVAYEAGQEPVSDAHHVMPDIEPFMSPDGKYITGRAAWRAHLKATDSVEMGHSDVKAAQQVWNKRKAEFQARLSNEAVTQAEKYLKGDSKPMDARMASRLSVEMANRLHGRPVPERKEMIRLTLDVAKRMRNRG